MQATKITASTQLDNTFSDGTRWLIRRIRYSLSQMLYQTEDIWNRLTGTEKAQRVTEFRNARNLLIELTQDQSPTIESPWSQCESEEEYLSMGADHRYPDKWYKFAPEWMQVAHAHLMVAVTEEDTRLNGRT
ncbi:hypothetical protein [Herbaspirillum sp. C7C8]|uniref:hypothetical protein n=1 Tax=Herbaspirillum sp. C7C8 TaxID=2736665 RepID=UPI001F51C79C|nr:hypothetical protein [Herbaspirillum sp. C7C8]MCI1005701.1 hypothetical protein [Herbaspirillum sp. C7C8]